MTDYHRQAKRLKSALQKEGVSLPLNKCQHLLAASLGFDNWQTLLPTAQAPAPATVPGVPKQSVSSAQANSLGGKFFHVMQSKDVVLWQGQVVYEIPQEFRVLLFKASRSGPTSERTAFRRDMFDWRFFDSEAQMMSSYASPSQGGEGYRLAPLEDRDEVPASPKSDVSHGG